MNDYENEFISEETKKQLKNLDKFKKVIENMTAEEAKQILIDACIIYKNEKLTKMCKDDD
jgi:hypothetical protein